MEFNGRFITKYTDGHQTAESRTWTLADMIQAVQDGATGMIHVEWYTIFGRRYKASALSVGPEHGTPREQDGALVVPTHFRRIYLGEPHREGDPDDLVAVDVIIDQADVEYVSLLQKREPDEATAVALSVIEEFAAHGFASHVLRDVIERKVREALNQRRFIAVFSDGGLITSIRVSRDLRELVLYVRTECDERFDSQTDDARIFDTDGDEVYVLPSPGELDAENLGEYYCPRCKKVERVKVAQTVFCTNCLDDMERLDKRTINH